MAHQSAQAALALVDPMQLLKELARELLGLIREELPQPAEAARVDARHVRRRRTLGRVEGADAAHRLPQPGDHRRREEGPGPGPGVSRRATAACLTRHESRDGWGACDGPIGSSRALTRLVGLRWLHDSAILAG